MNLTHTQRNELAARIKQERISKFGSKAQAYRAAGLNSATWDRLERGEPVREDRLIAAIKALWPASGGDWTQIDATPPAGPATIDTLALRVASLEERVRQLESHRKEVDQHEAASMNRAPVSGAEEVTMHVETGDMTLNRPGVESVGGSVPGSQDRRRKS